MLLGAPSQKPSLQGNTLVNQTIEVFLPDAAPPHSPGLLRVALGANPRLFQPTWSKAGFCPPATANLA